MPNIFLNRQKIIGLALAVLILGGWLMPVGAVRAVVENILPAPSGCANGTPEKDYSICDLLRVGVNLGTIAYYLLGGIVLLMIMVGSLYFITAHGNTEKIQAGRKIIRGAFTGAVIAILAYEIIGFVLLGILPSFNVKEGKIGETNFFYKNGLFDFDKILTSCQKDIKGKCPKK